MGDHTPSSLPDQNYSDVVGSDLETGSSRGISLAGNPSIEKELKLAGHDVQYGNIGPVVVLSRIKVLI